MPKDERGSKPDLSATRIERDVERRITTERDIEELRRELREFKEAYAVDLADTRGRLETSFGASKEAVNSVNKIQLFCAAFVVVVGVLGTLFGILKVINLTGGSL